MQKNKDVNLNDLTEMKPAILFIYNIVHLYCQAHGLPFVVTSMKSDREGIGKTRVHNDGRAFDLSIKGFSKTHIKRLVNHINGDFKELGAYSLSNGKQRVAVYGDAAHLDHIHFQVKRGANPVKYISFFD